MIALLLVLQLAAFPSDGTDGAGTAEEAKAAEAAAAEEAAFDIASSPLIGRSLGVITTTYKNLHGQTEAGAMGVNLQIRANGFLARSGGKVYFVTTRDALGYRLGGKYEVGGKSFVPQEDHPADRIEVFVPGIKKGLVIMLEPIVERGGIAAIDVTTGLAPDEIGDLVDFAHIRESAGPPQVDHGAVFVAGYPEGRADKPVRAAVWPLDKGFGLSQGLKARDDGSPVIAISDGEAVILGLYRTGMTLEEMTRDAHDIRAAIGGDQP